ncbi:tetrapyrrole (Corrin/Porphyrin) Methylases family protein, partial [Chlamydia psittaci 02DC14]
VMLIYA